jgi:hypothetical protein
VNYVDVAAKVFYIDDGSGRLDGSGITGIRVHCGSRANGTLSLPNVWNYVSVTGISTTSSGSLGIASVVRPRKQSDIVVLQ